MTATLSLFSPVESVTPAPAGGRVERLRRWLPSLIPGVLMGAVGLVGSTRPVLSWDEIATADAAHRSIGQIWQLVQHIDGVFGPYYLAMLSGRCWSATRSSICGCRRFWPWRSVAASGELGRRLFGTGTGLVAGVLLCLIPNLSRYAAEARPYALACMFATLSLVFLYRALDRPGIVRWAGYGLLVLCLGASQVVALTALVAHAAILALHRRRV